MERQPVLERHLVLMRHGQAANPVSLGRDQDRPLTAAGHEEAARTASALRAAGCTVDLITCSGARRARETAEVMAKRLGLDGAAILVVPSLYLGGLDALRDAASEWPATATGLLAVGHNPGWSQAATILSRASLILGTACAAVFTLHGVTWTEALHGPARFLGLREPG